MVNKKLAFSLIELSIVILIIGILVIGITKGARIIREAKLKSAIALTTSSPVNSISSLRIWIEPTLTKSFDISEAVDNSPITNWHNINPQDTNLADFTQGTGNAKPLYIASGINGLPMLKFDGTNDYLLSSLSQPITSDNLTAFIVCRRKSAVSGASASILYNSIVADDHNSPTGFIFAYESSGTALYIYRNFSFLSVKNPHPGNDVPYILTTVFNGTNNFLYYNGVAQNTVASTGNFNIDRIALGPQLYSPSFNDFYNGYIAELIVFDRAINNTERRSVEAYLSQKYGIKVQ